MKKLTLLQIMIGIVIVGIALPLFANTLTIPSEEHAAYTVDIPSDWHPKVDKEDESVQATSPDNHVYVTGWIVTKSDVSELTKDMADLLKDSMKSIEGEPKDETIENNGIKFTVVRGHGIDKREGGEVKFLVAIFPSGPGKCGIFYADWDADAPADITSTFNTVMNSIKLKK